MSFFVEANDKNKSANIQLYLLSLFLDVLFVSLFLQL